MSFEREGMVAQKTNVYFKLNSKLFLKNMLLLFFLEMESVTKLSSLSNNELDVCLKVLVELQKTPDVLCNPQWMYHSKLIHLCGTIKKMNSKAYKRRKLSLCVEKGKVSKELSSENVDIGLERYPRCYICKQFVVSWHKTLKSLCCDCGSLSIIKREQTVNLTNRVAVVTGARIKIGYQIALKLLRCHATVVATTRFVKDAYKRFAKEFDFLEWKARLHIVCADFSKKRDVEQLCNFISTHFSKIDILVNNAAQTIWRPPVFYQHLIDNGDSTALTLDYHHHDNDDKSSASIGLLVEHVNVETKVNDGLTEVVQSAEHNNFESADAPHTVFPVGMYDKHDQQVDLRSSNSWTLDIETTTVDELVETQIINCTVPFMLIQRLLPCLHRDPTNEYGFIVNVSAMEGSFSMQNKSALHPHTNIAKAGLNMITRTCASQTQKMHHVLMTSVDTGFITNEFPSNDKRHDTKPPLDEIDGAARVLDPIFSYFLHKTIYNGCFLKDYQKTNW